MKQNSNSLPEGLSEERQDTPPTLASTPLEQPYMPAKRRWRGARGGLMLTLVILAFILVYNTRQIVMAWPATSAQHAPVVSATSPAAMPSAPATPKVFNNAPIQLAGGTPPYALDVAPGRTLVYQDLHNIYMWKTGSTQNTILKPSIHTLPTPGYTYNRALPPLVTADKRLIYSGDLGIWQVNLLTNQTQQIASIPADQVITSLKVSQDGSTLAYSTAPANGTGVLNIYAGPFQHVQRIYQATAGRLPSFRVYSFLANSNSTLLLSDDRGDHRSSWYGLWSLTISTDAANPEQPRALLLDSALQGPLTLSPDGNSVLYSSDLGFAPTPLHDVPDDISSLTYANSLSLATIDSTHERLSDARTLLPGQGDLANTDLYRWIATPRFSADGKTLVYAEFSSDKSQNDRFPRYYALYSISTSGKSEPTLLASVNASYIELGDWLDDHTITFYANNTLYALDLQHHALAKLVTTNMYARVVTAF